MAESRSNSMRIDRPVYLMNGKNKIREEKTLFAVILAAGESKRFGSTKQLAQFGEEALVTKAVRLAETVCSFRTILVTGNDWQSVADECGPLQGFFVFNSEFREGIATSIHSGLAAISWMADAALIVLADQPLITVEHLAKLEAIWLAAPNSIVATSYAGTAGPPVIFPRSYFPNINELDGDRGAKAMIDDKINQVELVCFENAGIDIDRVEDLHELYDATF